MKEWKNQIVFIIYKKKRVQVKTFAFYQIINKILKG